MLSGRLCIACLNPAELMCSRCNDFYCSAECQRIDWQRHRSQCFSMPSLTSAVVDSLGQKFSFNLTLPKTKAVNSSSVESIPGIIQGKSSSAPEAEPQSKPVDKQVSTPKDKSPVNKKEENLPKASPPTVEKPASVKPVTKIDPTPSPTPQTLKTSTLSNRGPQKFNQTLVKKPEAPKHIFMKDLPVREWPKSKNVKVKVVCVLEEKVMFFRENNTEVEAYYDYISQEISKYCNGKNKGDYKPVLGEVVCALFEGEWYRGEVMGPADDGGYIVKYIEYGNIENVKPSDIMPAGDSAKFDVCGKDFFVDNFTPDLSDKQLEMLGSEELLITNILKASDGLLHCSIVGF